LLNERTSKRLGGKCHLYHSQWRDTKSKAKNSDKEANGNNHFLIIRQTKKMAGGRQGEFYLQEDL
jgi:hypothetical protein